MSHITLHIVQEAHVAHEIRGELHDGLQMAMASAGAGRDRAWQLTLRAVAQLVAEYEAQR